MFTLTDELRAKIRVSRAYKTFYTFPRNAISLRNFQKHLTYPSNFAFLYIVFDMALVPVHAAANDNPDLYDFNPQHRDWRVTQVYMVGVPVDYRDPTSVLHWRLHLVISSGQSVKVDFVLDDVDNYLGYLHVASRRYVLPSRVHTYGVAPTTGWVTVGQILDLIIYQGLHRYLYNDGAGCRYWCMVVIDRLAAAGLVVSNARARIEQMICGLSVQSPDVYPHPTIQGTFPH
ncbi:hypothetical protein RhiJN_20035 [Ceratobasidium sp. AG-Ba]|nr:hypothetical protein RhiJN_20035 [Ceratobasidium sp. AG-Ba]